MGGKTFEEPISRGDFAKPLPAKPPASGEIESEVAFASPFRQAQQFADELVQGHDTPRETAFADFDL
jgi:hypothetical protein